MARFPGFELTGEVVPPGLMQLGHGVGVLRGEPVLEAQGKEAALLVQRVANGSLTRS